VARDAGGGVGRRAARGAATHSARRPDACKTPRLGDAALTAGFGPPANLSATPTLKHPDHEEEAEGGVPVMVLEDALLDFRARACHNQLGVRNGRRTGVRRADSGDHTSHAGGYEQ
jgi:hypothetical protein